MAGFLDAPMYSDDATNRELKLKIDSQFLSLLSDTFEKNGGKALRSLIFDPKKYAKDAAIQWAKERGLDTSDVAASEKCTVIGLRPHADFEVSDLSETVNLGEGIDAVVKKLNPLAVENRTLGIQYKKVLRQEGDKWCVYSHDGKKNLGCHPDKEAALKQLRAIEVNKNVEHLQQAVTILAQASNAPADEKDPLIQQAIVAINDAIEHYASADPAGELYKPGVMKMTKSADGVSAFELYFPIEKLNDEEREVMGIVYMPDTVDAQGDSASAAEIKKAVHKFNTGARTLGIMHKERAGDRAHILESYIAPVDFRLNNRLVKRGTWIMVVKVHDDELWGKVKSGKITGFSMAGRAKAENQ